MSPRITLAVLLLTVPASSAVFAQEKSKTPAVHERDVVEVDPAKPITLVHIDNRIGDVRIEGHDDKKVVISAFKRAGDSDTLDRLKVTLVPDPGGSVRISTSITAGKEARTIPAGTVKLDLVIRAPRSAEVNARVWNGRLEMHGMENGAELSANNGDIEVKNASGTIVTHSATGSQRFEEIFGAVDAQALAGEMALEVVRGQRLDASVHEGRIDGRQVRVRHATMRTTRGDIRFAGQALAGGRYSFASYRGNVEVSFAHTTPLAIRAHSRKGTIRFPRELATRIDERGWTTATVGGRSSSAAIVELRSRMGNIQFTVVE